MLVLRIGDAPNQTPNPKPAMDVRELLRQLRGWPGWQRTWAPGLGVHTPPTYPPTPITHTHTHTQYRRMFEIYPPPRQE